MEPTGTYGDVLRQALSDVGLPLERVSAKAAHDYAEIFDGVPSQHDGKDAAVVAELAAAGKSTAWPYETPSETEREMAYHVDWMDAQQRQGVMWLGRLEGLTVRHWPEAREWLRLSSGTLLRALAKYGGAEARGKRAGGEVPKEVQETRVGRACPATFHSIPFAPAWSVRVSFEGPGQTDSVKSPMRPIRRSSVTATRSRKQV